MMNTTTQTPHTSPGLIPTQHPESIGEEELAILESGASIATTRCGGQIGWLYIERPTIEATLYPGGLIVKPPHMAVRTIPLARITRVVFHDHGWSYGVEIVQDLGPLHSRTVLNCQVEEPFHKALRDWFERNQISAI